MNRPTIYFIGGPLDGIKRDKRAPARSPLYRDIDGDPLPVALGDRIVNGRSAAHSCYVRTPGTEQAGSKRIITYKHVTAEETAS